MGYDTIKMTTICRCKWYYEFVMYGFISSLIEETEYFMIRVVLAQIFYKPAIIEKQIDYLAEPGFALHGPCTASLLEELSEEQGIQLQTLHNQIREQYINYISEKLNCVCQSACHIYEPDILVFPEYSVPYQCLPKIKELSEQLGITIVAGTHTVISAAREYYIQAGFEAQVASDYSGCSIAPVFFHDKAPDFQVKNGRSIFEVTMREANEDFKQFHATTRCGESYSFSVIICADALKMSTVGKADIGLADAKSDNYMVITVACSTNPQTFEGAAQLFALQGIPMLICNASQYGYTGIYIPEAVKERFTNVPGQASFVQSQDEMLMLLELQPDYFSVQKGVLDNKVRGSWALCPIYYEGQHKWKTEYLQAMEGIEKSLQLNVFEDAIDYAEILLTLCKGQLPSALESAFKGFIIHAANFSGDIRSCLLPLKAVLMDIHSTQAHMYNEFPAMISFCVKVGKLAMPQIQALIEQRDKYPEEEIVKIQPTLPATVTRAQPTQEEDDKFRDRGNYMTQLQNAIVDPTVKLILVSGAYGIGKTSTVSMTFRRHLPNWSARWVSLAATTRFSMVLEYMANAIGHPLTADTLARNRKKVLKPILEQFTMKLFGVAGRAIIVDQMENILLGLQGRDHTLLTLFLNAVFALQGGGGKVIFLSDVRFSRGAFPESPAVRRIVMGRIPDNRDVKRILEYEMRKRDMIAPGEIPNIPDKLYELVNGHPLTAKLSIDVMDRHGGKAIDSIVLGQVQAQVIRQLMEKICLDEVETQILCILSVFRTLINMPKLMGSLPQKLCDLLNDNIDRLYQISFISAGDDTIEITAVFRNYYYEKIPRDQKNEYHEYALHYYIGLYKELMNRNQFSAMIYAEIAYHLTCLNRMEQLKDYLPGNVSTLKQLAKTLYQRDKNYTAARQIYYILNTACPKDVEVLSYLGRCCARMNDWEQTEKYFKDAIDVAESSGEDTWYLYRDWGHLNVRFYMDEEAQNNFSKARILLRQECHREEDAGILSAEGFLLERNQDIHGAMEKYEAALAINRHNEFTISNYSKLLRKYGNDEYASELESMLGGENFDGLGESTDDFYSGFDIIDVDMNLYDE